MSRCPAFGQVAASGTIFAQMQLDCTWVDRECQVDETDRNAVSTCDAESATP